MIFAVRPSGQCIVLEDDREIMVAEAFLVTKVQKLYTGLGEVTGQASRTASIGSLMSMSRGQDEPFCMYS